MKEFNKNQHPDAIKNALVDDYCPAIDMGIEIINEQIDIHSDDQSCMIIVAGKTKAGMPVIKYRTNQNPEWAYQAENIGSITPVIFNPSDVSKNECMKILERSINDFRYKTGGMIVILRDVIEKIARKSKSVNDNVDIWLCDAASIINQK